MLPSWMYSTTTNEVYVICSYRQSCRGRKGGEHVPGNGSEDELSLGGEIIARSPSG